MVSLVIVGSRLSCLFLSSIVLCHPSAAAAEVLDWGSRIGVSTSNPLMTLARYKYVYSIVRCQYFLLLSYRLLLLMRPLALSMSYLPIACLTPSSHSLCKDLDASFIFMSQFEVSNMYKNDVYCLKSTIPSHHTAIKHDVDLVAED